MMRFKVEIDKKIRDLSEDTKLIENYEYELEEVKKRHLERQMASSLKSGVNTLVDHLSKNKLVAAEWYHA